MADYHALLARAVSGLPDATLEARRAIYERARKALLGQLSRMEPAVAPEDIAREEAALDEAVARIEAERSVAAPPLAPAPPDLVAPPEAAARRPFPTSRPSGSRPLPLPTQRPAIERPPLRNGGVRPSASPRPVAPTSSPVLEASSPVLAAPAPVSVETGVVEAEATAGSVLASLAPEAAVDRAPPLALAPAPSEHDGTEPSADESSFLHQFGRARAGDASRPPASDNVAAPELAPASRDILRPAAPAPPPLDTPRGGRLLLTVVGALLLITGGVAWLAIKYRDNPEDYARAKPPLAEQGPGKIAQRVGGGASVSPDQAGASDNAQAGVPVAQRAAFLVEAPDEAQGVKTYVGDAVWSSNGAGPSQAIHVDLTFPDAKLKVGLTMAKNFDPTLPASLTMELRFAPAPDSEFAGGVAKINMPQTRAQDRPLGEALIGVPLAITSTLFRVSLINEPGQSARNMDALRNRPWIDVPLQLTTGRLGKLTFEKGAGAERLMAQAIDAWR